MQALAITGDKRNLERRHHGGVGKSAEKRRLVPKSFLIGQESAGDERLAQKGFRGSLYAPSGEEWGSLMTEPDPLGWVRKQGLRVSSSRSKPSEKSKS